MVYVMGLKRAALSLLSAVVCEIHTVGRAPDLIKKTVDFSISYPSKDFLKKLTVEK